MLKSIKRVEPALAIQVAVFGFLLLGASDASAQATGALGAVTTFLRDITRLVFLEWGYYIAMLGAGLCIAAGFTGHLQWKTVIICLGAIFIFFCVPGLVSMARDQASSAF
jgi:type IV secretory pathway VirB2 component (pilin)